MWALVSVLAFAPPPREPKSVALRSVADHLKSAQNVVVLCGAGISVSAGIPDFRSPGTGLYDNLQEYGLPFPEAVFDLQVFASNPKPFYRLCHELWPGSVPARRDPQSCLLLMCSLAHVCA